LFFRSGYDVVGVDISDVYVAALNNKTFASKEPGVAEMLQTSKNFLATTDLKVGVEHSKYLYILVDTPSTGGDRHYDVR
jgi:UDP-glucose 6-dehydrogenase